MVLRHVISRAVASVLTFVSVTTFVAWADLVAHRYRASHSTR